MAYGLRLKAADGRTVYDSSSVTWMLLGVFSVGGGKTQTRTYPLATGLEIITQQWMINSPPDDQEATAHTVTHTGTRVTATGGTESSYILVLGR